MTPIPASRDHSRPSADRTYTLRRPVAIILSRFPLVTETFILREVLELERQGQPVRLIPLLKLNPEVVHAEALPWVDRALYTPFLSPEILRSNLTFLRREPRRYVAVLTKVLLGSLEGLGVFVRTLALWPKSVYLASRLQEEGIRHIHAHYATYPTLTSLILSSLTNISFSFTVHAHDIFVGRALLKEKIQAARFVRTISTFNKRFLEKACPGIADSKCRVIHVGVEPERYGPRSSPSFVTSRSQGGAAKILSVAQLKPYKGVPVLVRAVKELVDSGVELKCDVVGDGPLRPKIDRLISELGLSDVVRLLGWQPQQEVARLMGQATVFVLPSILAKDGQMEGIPVALMEAMAAERPVVASCLSGIPELIDDGVNGLLVPPSDAGALARAIRRLLDDGKLREAMGKRGRQRVQKDFLLTGCVAELRSELDRHNEFLSFEQLGGFKECGEKALAGGDIGLRRTHDREDSRVMELVVGGEPRKDVIYKTQKFVAGQSDVPKERARREFEVLQTLYRRFHAHAGLPSPASCDEPQRYGVPMPLCLDLERAAILMKACVGLPLDVLIRKERAAWGRGLRPSLGSAVWRAGRWLALMQRETVESADAEPVLQAVLAFARDDIARCRERGMSIRLADKALGRLEQLQRNVDPTTLAVVGHHGDLWPGNIYVTSDSVEVIDFEGFRDGLPLEDVAYFLVHLGQFFSYPGLGKQLQEITASFLDGFCSLEERARPTEADIEFYRLIKTVQVFAHSELGLAAADLAARWRQRALFRILRGS